MHLTSLSTLFLFIVIICSDPTSARLKRFIFDDDDINIKGDITDDDDDEEPTIFNYNLYLKKPHSTRVNSKSKVETLGKVLKQHINVLKETANKEVDIIFLVDGSTSVGKANFREEIKFVKKLLSDFTVDEHHTRVSVITFSSREKVIRHVDYFDKTKKDRHKCSLLEEDLKSIDYSGGGTYTLGAFLEAKKVLKNARESASKAIFLITDGFSNGGDPRNKARELKQQGVKIFTFGIQNGNVRELYDMASHPKNESCYILDSFEEFEALAKRALHEDLNIGQYTAQPDKKCNRLCVGQGCCDTLATCNCGTHTGKYECICPPGYHGNGLRGGCQPCPPGTFKADMTPGDINTCTKCPDENHVTEPGATSHFQCVCRKGYRNFNDTGCAVLKCHTLSVPKSGYFVNDKCKNVFNAACGLRCKPGYELRGSSLRICREDGTWSGTDTECNMKTCPALMIPKNGNMICTTDDFTFNTVCRFTCDMGYKLVGSRKRTCLAIAFWTGINTRCREITCRPLSVVRDGSIHPPSCTAGDVAFGTTCSITCSAGYTRIGPQRKQCLPEGVWTPAEDVVQCLDNSPPFIMCPYNIEAETDLNENFATVSWQVPLAVDNSGYLPILTAIPAVSPPARFAIGVTKVTYIAEDLNKNQADCQFYVTVKDKQKPTIDRCASPLPVVSPEPYADVFWGEPDFSDNSGEDVRLQRSHAPGLFPNGRTEVTYTAYDNSGNNNTCILTINVIPHPCEYPGVPLNGNRTCYEDIDGVVCSFSCKSGYDFAIRPAQEYRCAFDNDWEPKDQMPISDCSALQLADDIIQPASFTFVGLVACHQRLELTRLEKDFEQMVSKRVLELCEEGVNCEIKDLETTCVQSDDSNVKIVLGREKRKAVDRHSRNRREADEDVDRHSRNRRETDEIVDETPMQKDNGVGEATDAIVTFSYVLTGSLNASKHLDEEERFEQQQKLLTTVENIVNTLKKDAKRGDISLKSNGKPMELSDMTFDEDPAFVCETGSVAVDKSCAQCPVGTFFNVVSLVCESCKKGTFQPLTGQMSCIFCPTNTSTPNLHTTTEDDCRALCLPGTFSFNGLEQCETCKKSYFQMEYGRTGCEKCPKRFTTLRRGSRGQEACLEKCDPGYYSKTGLRPCWPCPRGTYQSKAGKNSCTKCHGNADTLKHGSTDITQCELSLSDGPQANDPFDPFGGGQQAEELLADECLDDPCQNGATCISGLVSFECICAPGYTDIFCQEEIDECSVNPCLNQGTCVDLLADYSCLCPMGYTGKKCEENIDDCIADSCFNGATCVDGLNGYTCSCANGYTGKQCETNINECSTAPCRNGGTCRDEIAKYRCTCPDGITGDNCEIDEDNCASGPCQNEATCVDGVGTFTCQCALGFTGSTCDVDIDECANNPCSDAAKCEDQQGGYVCHCPSGFTGADCTEEIDIYFQMDFPATASTTDYAKVPLTTDMKSATVCFWMKSDDIQNQGTPFSYATAEGDNIFTLTDYDGFVFFVNGEKITTTVKANDGTWKHVCVLWSSNRGSWKIYMNGIPVDSGRNLANGQTIKGGGMFVIGQEQDSVGGGFSSPESFIGQLSQLNVWSRELSLDDIEALRLSCQKQLGDVIAWPDVSGKLQGAVTDSPIEFCKDCPVPESIDYGDVENGGTIAGSIATYTCARGFNVEGRSERQCLVSGEWEGRTPSCQRVQCGYPGSFDYGWIEGGRYTFDNRIRYFCNNGYQLQGDATRYCGEYGFWEGQVPVCEQIMCTIPILSENTRVINSTPNNKYKPGTDVGFECTPGFEFFTAHTEVYCQRDGTWDKSIPTCDPQKCEPPSVIEKGKFENPDGLVEFSVGYRANYSCDFGFMISRNSLNPSSIIACLPSGQWEPNLPECVLVQCGIAPSIANGRYESSGNNFLDQIQYSCNVGYELTDDTVLECYETGEWSPAPPECIPVRCGRPDDVLHGYFEGEEYTYNSLVTYKCNLGYILLGTSDRMCLADATWNGELPVCKPVSCGKPGAIEHGTTRGRDYTLNNLVRYVCDEGFRLDGSEEIICRETGKWQNEPPSCRRVECDYPQTVKHAFFLDTSFLFEDNVTYECEEGFYMDSDSSPTLTCLSNKQWSLLPPVCLEIMCSYPPRIENGNFPNPLRQEMFPIGERVQLACNIGYQISINSIDNSGQLECLDSGQWETSLPECEFISCRQPLPVLNGKMEVVSLTYKSVVTYTCNEAYELQGDSTMTCEADGTWSGQFPTCKALQCQPPDLIPNGQINFKDLNLGSVARYVCSDGYERFGLEVRRCEADLSYSGDEPECRPIQCGEPDDIVNGFKQSNGRDFQAIVTYECNVGYQLIGDRTRSCAKEKLWSGKAPSCEIIQCDKPARVTSNGRMDGTVFAYGSVISYICDEGYFIDGPTNLRTCLATGKWDNRIPICIAVECPRLSVLHGFASGFQTEFGTTITLSCRPGYRLSGSTERTCQGDGSWSGEQTICSKYACPRLEPPTNGQVLVQGGVANYICLEGFTLSGNSRRECQSDDTWSYSDPTCDAVPCNDITASDFANGFLTYTQLVFGQSIIYECDVGYGLVGERQLDCLADGTWSDAVPFCQKAECFSPFTSFNSKVIGDDFTYNATVRYECEQGYELIGQTDRVCQADGSWSGFAPTCDLVICPRPEANSNVIIYGTQYTFSSVIEYLCNSGFDLVGPKYRNCTINRTWSGDEPRCTRSECPKPVDITNGRIYGQNYDQGSRITYECNEGYLLMGLSFRLCLGSLEWTGSDPYCQEVVCPEPPVLENGYINGADRAFKASIEYQCNPGYQLVGENRRVCLSIGTWGGADPSCIKVKCAIPSPPANARFSLSENEEEGEYLEQAGLACEEGYIGIGTNYQLCQANGEWSETNFKCEVVTCYKFDNVFNGNVIGNNYTFGSELEIQCHEGYELMGKQKIECLANGEWNFESEPFCNVISCPSLPALSNGNLVYDGRSISGAMVTYSCNDGYRLLGKNRRYCKTNGQWGGKDPYCSLIICEVPPYVEHAREFDSTAQYLFNSEARYTCEKGYSISSGDSSLTCSQTGQWTGIVPTCALTSCGEPQEVINTQTRVDSYEYNGQTEYICDEGYRLKGQPIVTCDETGNWKGELPACVLINCGEPPLLKNAIFIDTKQYWFKSIMTYFCDQGHKLKGNSQIKCLATGVWSTTPICEPVSCGEPPEIDNAIFTGDKRVYKSFVTYMCVDGYEMTGQSELVCSYNGAWVGEHPTCHALTCGPPPVLSHASTTMTMGEGIGSDAVFLCNEGYYLIGSASAKCTPNKRWEYEDSPSCHLVDCEDLDFPKHGLILYSDTTFGSTATYGCDEGYYLKGASTRVCQSDGSWQGDARTCEPVSCGDPPHSDHSTVSSSSSEYKGIADYSCNAGYKTVGSTSLTCTKHGHWSNNPPQCLRISCTPLSLPANGIMLKGDINFDTFYGDRVVLACESGYLLMGDAELECLDTGVWSKEQPKCQFIPEDLNCDSDTGFPNVRLVTGPLFVGTETTLECKTGYQSNVDMASTCEENQRWSSPGGSCSRVFCGKPRLRDFVNVVRISGSSYNYGDQVRFRCRAGVQPARSPPVITCTEFGAWDGDIACGVTCKRPCQNGGICLGLNRCKCPMGYGGLICEQAQCILPCLNGGKCSSPYKCSCPSGYKGVRCNKAICKKKCAHGGRCLKPNKCKCRHGYTGAFCGRKRI